VKAARIVARPYRDKNRPSYKWVLDLRAYGKGRMFFKTKWDAEQEQCRRRVLLQRQGDAALRLSQRDLADLITAKERLAEYGKTVSEAAEFLIHHEQKIRRCNVTVKQLANEVIETKECDGRSERYLESLRGYLRRFSRDFGDRPIAAVTPEELDTWLRDLPYAPKSRLNFRQHIGVLFSYAKQRRMISENPIEFTTRPKIVDAPPGILTAEETQALLEAASRFEPDTVPMLAIGAFCGLRDSEVHRLNWSEVNLSRGFVEVTAAKAKSARRRLVPIQPNLSDWLRPYSALTGPVVAESYRGKVERVRKWARLTTWPRNALRHSFASYRLAATNDAPRVALELGYTSPHLLFQHYRELVSPEEGDRYFNIKPPAEAANVIALGS
jgi:integrase